VSTRTTANIKYYCVNLASTNLQTFVAGDWRVFRSVKRQISGIFCYYVCVKGVDGCPKIIIVSLFQLRSILYNIYYDAGLILTDFVVLSVPAGPLTIYEGDEENTVNQTCFTAFLNRPRFRDSIFIITVSNMSTATPGSDFKPLQNIPVPADFPGEVLEECVNITVIGDTIVEEDELILFAVTALSPLDMVTSSDGSNTLRATIVDNDGKSVSAWKGYKNLTSLG
jgi:hypothetical protein